VCSLAPPLVLLVRFGATRCPAVSAARAKRVVICRAPAAPSDADDKQLGAKHVTWSRGQNAPVSSGHWATPFSRTDPVAVSRRQHHCQYWQ